MMYVLKVCDEDDASLLLLLFSLLFLYIPFQSPNNDIA